MYACVHFDGKFVIRIYHVSNYYIHTLYISMNEHFVFIKKLDAVIFFNIFLI